MPSMWRRSGNHMAHIKCNLDASVKEDQGVAMGIDFHDDTGLPMIVATRFRLVDWEPRIVEAMTLLLSR
ncbi:hypothetical protein SESBI_15175 [Sesbania bispinosa]|nr:hypothetical protein SESBI_15175 [Sesbania bispinosa]